uniref:Odorant binding protein 10 n=1 Tax=Adelphocoris suturalis TaxID=323751 RepID=W8E9Z9_9HEMI|nr:odorant binding protein 10 [Adelphocoris suturalis]
MFFNSVFLLVVCVSSYVTKGQELPPPGDVKNKTVVFKNSFLRSAKYCSSIYETSTLAIMALLMSEKSDDQNGKCFLNCMLQRYRLMSQDGSYNKDKFKPFLEYIPDSKFLQPIRGNLKNCISEKDPDPCEKASKFVKCFYTRARNKGEIGASKEVIPADGF